MLRISFTEVGVEGSCPAEKDNDGCFFIGQVPEIKIPEIITSNKIFCDCKFEWIIPNGAKGLSVGKTIPAFSTDVLKVYPKQELTIENAARIPCSQVLSSYVVEFNRD
ncbi:hypothetical protein [Anaerosacchariphilus polymeriproducens]|uniref:Uncharacterized protein n=1 Tax=Anaerosacchariphilus polymeriproducens TaxID=1812858 RepID=A0A371AW13_9FIRM|nr:hypothetical protein [Anaerosacchariphilus polymeriproducens]RDU23729.1 hypothetical protein DWV06_07675 [Anaerosacchariphilus polymeriproducens]